MIAMEPPSTYEEGSGVPPIPTFPLCIPDPAESDTEEEEEEEEEEGAVLGTPPHKKVWDGHGRAWGQRDRHSPLLTPTSPHSFALCFLARCWHQGGPAWPPPWRCWRRTAMASTESPEGAELPAPHPSSVQPPGWALP